MSRRRATLPLLVASALGLLALVETANALLAPRRAASERDWEEAAALVRADLRPDDLIVFAPGWVDPIGRAHLGDRMPLGMVGRSDADRYRRIWELSIRDARAPETAGATERLRRARGKVRVTLYEKPAATVLWDDREAFAAARVTQQLGGGGLTSCAPASGAFHCPGSQVELRTLEIDYRPRRGLLVPVEGARTTTVAFDDVPGGGRLIFYAGLHDYYARKSGDGKATAILRIDGRERLRAEVGSGDGWQRFELDTHDLAAGGHQLEVAVASPRPAWRNLGFHVEVRQ